MRALLANVSHDLKTPLTSITGYAQSLVDGTAAAGDHERIGGVIREEAEHVNRLLADLLYLGQIDAGQLIALRDDVPLEAVVERCVRRMAPAAADRNVNVAVDVEPEAILRAVDPEKIERALTNVLDNAVKFTDAGGAISVRGWRDDGAIACSVRNTGPQIAEDDLGRIFDRFFRSDRARRSSQGSGLGLAISRELMALHGGTITAHNEPDGVTFEVRLPL
jgi:signal transduction histidine kinase